MNSAGSTGGKLPVVRPIVAPPWWCRSNVGPRRPTPVGAPPRKSVFALGTHTLGAKRERPYLAASQAKPSSEATMPDETTSNPQDTSNEGASLAALAVVLTVAMGWLFSQVATYWS